MLKVQKIGQWANPKRAAKDPRSVLPLALRSYISPIIPIIINMGLTSYGQFISDTFYTTNPGAAFTYTNSSTSGMSLATPTEIEVANAGDYLVDVTVNWQNAGALTKGRQWIQVNGVDVPLSCVECNIDGATTNQIPIHSQFMLIGLSALDRIKVWYANESVTLTPTQQVAITGAPTLTWQYDSPAVPSAIVTVLQLST